MKVVGIICEYNPFHNGHLYHLQKAKEIAGDGIVIAILTGYFSMRGDISVINKFDKVKTAIDNGVDITIELPYLLGTQNADIFAHNSVKFLSELGVDEIVAGSECNDINIINQALNLENDSQFQDDIKVNLKKGFSYRKSYSLAIEKHGLNLSSNDMLNIKYLQAIRLLKKDIKLTLIKRINNNYNDTKLNESNIQSATAIRNTSDIKNYVPEYISNIYNEKGFYNLNSFTPILKHLLLTENLHDIFQAHEGIENSFNKEFTTIDQLIDSLTTKRYTKSRIRRFITYILTKTTKGEINLLEEKNKIRVTGFNQKGQKYLSSIKKEIPYFTRLVNDISYVYDKELMIAKIFTNVFNENFIKVEQSLPYKK